MEFVEPQAKFVNEKKNPHKSFGYLRTPELADIVSSFLKGDSFR